MIYIYIYEITLLPYGFHMICVYVYIYEINYACNVRTDLNKPKEDWKTPAKKVAVRTS